MDELQNIWQTHNEKLSTKYSLSESELEKILIKKSNDALQKINKVMMIDIFIMIVISSLFITITFVLDLENKYSISYVLLSMVIILGLHYWVKYHLLNKQRFTDDNLSDIIKRKLKYMKWYQWIYTFGATFMFIVLYTYLQTILIELGDLKFEYNSIILFKYTTVIPLAILIYLFTKWVYKLLFGEKLKILREVISKLD